jgi:DnaJ-class molecular chaperone
MTGHDFYQVLGVPRGAAPDEIRAAYVRLAKRHHPDVHGSLPTRLREVQQAYRCLSDGEARGRHDRVIAEAERSHLARQQRVQRRLGRYDRRHSHDMARPDRRRWPLLVAATGIAIVVGVSVMLLG